MESQPPVVIVEGRSRNLSARIWGKRKQVLHRVDKNLDFNQSKLVIGIATAASGCVVGCAVKLFCCVESCYLLRVTQRSHLGHKQGVFAEETIRTNNKQVDVSTSTEIVMLMVPRVVLLVALISVLASAEKRVLRRGDKNLGNRNTGECLEHPDLQLSQVGQRTADSIEDFMSPSPNLHIHRTKFGYTDESVLAFYHSASLHFLNLYGVDFSRVPTDPETGARTLGNFMLKPQVVDFGLRIPYTSVHGRFDCAREVFDEGLVFMVTGDDIYHGSFGGSAGKPAKAGDFAPFGHYAIDFDNDGDFTMMRYQAAGPPVRPTPIGIFHIDCDIFSMRWGWGKSEGTFDWKATNDAGKPHVASRSVLSFPSRYQMAARAGFP